MSYKHKLLEIIEHDKFDPDHAEEFLVQVLDWMDSGWTLDEVKTVLEAQ